MGRGRTERSLARPVVALASGLLALVLFPAVALGVLGDFTEPSTSPEPAGKTSESVAAGDFNGDGDADLVVANKDSNNLTVLLNDGKGDFSPAPTSPEAVTGPWQVIVANLNGDANLDLAVSTETAVTDGAVAVLLGDGSGNFTATTPEPIDAPTRNLAAGDLDGDGDQDLAVAEHFPAAVAVLLNDGGGDFSEPPSSAEDAGGSGTNVTSIVTGDFNDDEAVDIVAGSEFSNEIRVYLNDGDEDGDFTVATPITGVDGTTIASGFFDAGDVPDLAVGEGAKKQAAILLGNGAGSFAPAPTSPEALPNEVRWVTSADLNGDGKADLAATGGNTPGFAAILLGNGAGDFTAAASSPESVGSVPISIAAAPLNDDASVDLVVANIFTEKVNILFNDFAPDTEPPTEEPPQQNPPATTPPPLTPPAPAPAKKTCPKGKQLKKGKCVAKKCPKGKKLKKGRCVKKKQPQGRRPQR